MSYLADVRALARKDLLLELRARDTLPAMLLFVVATFVVFHFALPAGSSKLAASGLLWVAIVFTALLGLGRECLRRLECAALGRNAVVSLELRRDALGIALHVRDLLPEPRDPRCGILGPALGLRPPRLDLRFEVGGNPRLGFC